MPFCSWGCGLRARDSALIGDSDLLKQKRRLPVASSSDTLMSVISPNPKSDQAELMSLNIYARRRLEVYVGCARAAPAGEEAAEARL